MLRSQPIYPEAIALARLRASSYEEQRRSLEAERPAWSEEERRYYAPCGHDDSPDERRRPLD